jgi:hypothetical protein
MLEEFAKPQSKQGARETKAGFNETRPRPSEPEWQTCFAELCAEIAWGTDPASATVQRLRQRCRQALKAFTGRGASRATGGPATGT